MAETLDLAELDLNGLAELITAEETAYRAAERAHRATEDPVERIRMRQHRANTLAAQRQAAERFGIERGWRLTTRDFNLRTLADGKKSDGRWAIEHNPGRWRTEIAATIVQCRRQRQNRAALTPKPRRRQAAHMPQTQNAR